MKSLDSIGFVGAEDVTVGRVTPKALSGALRRAVDVDRRRR